MKRQFVLVGGSRAAGAFLQAATVILLGRFSSLDAFGFIGVIMSIGAFALTVADFGVSTLIVKEYSQREFVQVDELAALNLLTTLATALVGLVAILCISLQSGIEYIWFTLLVLGLALEKNTDTLLGTTIAADRPWDSVTSILVRRLCLVAVTTIAAISGFDVVAAYCAGYFLSSVVSQLHIRWVCAHRLAIAPHISPRAALPALHRCVPYALSNITAQSRLLDVTIIGTISGVSAAGLYSAGQRLTNPMMLVPQTVTSLVLPRASKSSRNEALRLSMHLIAWTVAAAAVCAPMIWLGSSITSLLFGEDFAPAGPIFGLLLVSVPVVGLSSTLGSILQGQGQASSVAMNGIIFAVVCIGLIAFGALFFGGAAAALAVLATYAVKCLVLEFMILRLQERDF